LKVHLSGPPGIFLTVEDVGPVAGTVPAMAPNTDARWNTAWGVIGVGSFPFGDGTGLTPGAAMVNPLSVAIVANRRYRVTFVLRAFNNGANAGNNVMLVADGVDVVERHEQVIAGAGYKQVNTHWLWSGSTGTHTFSVKWAGTAGSVGYPSGGHFYVEDVGPVSGAVPVVDPTPAWINVTFLNGWANNAGGNQLTQYRKVGDEVQLRGRLYGGAMNVPIFNLPVGFRPSLLTALGTASVISGGWGFGIVEIASDGNLATYLPSTNQGLILNGLSFSVTP